MNFARLLLGHHIADKGGAWTDDLPVVIRSFNPWARFHDVTIQKESQGIDVRFKQQVADFLTQTVESSIFSLSSHLHQKDQSISYHKIRIILNQAKWIATISIKFINFLSLDFSSRSRISWTSSADSRDPKDAVAVPHLWNSEADLKVKIARGRRIQPVDDHLFMIFFFTVRSGGASRLESVGEDDELTVGNSDVGSDAADKPARGGRKHSLPQQLDSAGIRQARRL